MTTEQNILLYGSFDRYWSADHVRGTLIDSVPIVFDQASGRPNATRGVLLSWRAGADMVDPDAARVLKL